MRRFVVVGQRARGDGVFSLADLPGTSGRLDVLLRCVRAGLLVSHGLRRDTVVYLVLLGTAVAPRCLRFDGSAAKYLRPDERSMAVTAQKAMVTKVVVGEGFVMVRPGVAVAEGGMEAVLRDAGEESWVMLDEGGGDLREAELDAEGGVYVLGDDRGFDAETRAALEERCRARVSVGPVVLQSDDVVAIVQNELDRRAARGLNAGVKPTQEPQAPERENHGSTASGLMIQ